MQPPRQTLMMTRPDTMRFHIPRIFRRAHFLVCAPAAKSAFNCFGLAENNAAGFHQPADNWEVVSATRSSIAAEPQVVTVPLTWKMSLRAKGPVEGAQIIS